MAKDWSVLFADISMRIFPFSLLRLNSKMKNYKVGTGKLPKREDVERKERKFCRLINAEPQ